VTRPPREVSRLAEWTLAGSLSAVGLATVALRLLADPKSRLSQWVDRKIDAAVTLPAGGAR